MTETKPASKHVRRETVERVAACLSVVERLNAPSIKRRLAEEGIVLTARAIRYAVQVLIETGRARRFGRTGQRTWVLAIPHDPASKLPVDTQIGI